MRMKTILLTGLGIFLLALGAIGLLLPIWPTTPFILVSAACFSSAPRIKSRIMKIPFFREHIENYEHRKGLSQKTFRLSMLWLWGMLIISILLISNTLSLILLPVIGLAVTVHLVYMAKGKKKEDNL